MERLEIKPEKGIAMEVEDGKDFEININKITHRHSGMSCPEPEG